MTRGILCSAPESLKRSCALPERLPKACWAMWVAERAIWSVQEPFSLLVWSGIAC